MNLPWRPPRSQNEDENRIAAHLHVILIAFSLVALVLTAVYLIFPIARQALSVLISGSSLLLFLVALWILHKGRVRLAGGVLIIHLFLITTWIAVNFDGIFDASIVVYFLLIAITGLLLGARAAFVAALLSIGGVFAIYYATVLLPETVTPPQQDPDLRAVETMFLLLLMGVVLRVTISDLSRALQRARREAAERKEAEEALAAANRALQTARDELEARVARRTRELAQVNRDLHTLIQSSRDAILFLDPDLCLSVINGRALTLLSLPGTVSDWKGRPVQALAAELAETAPDVAAVVEKETERLRRGARLNAEGTFAIAATFLHGYTVPVPISEEEVAHLVVLRDITTQRQAEQMQHDMIRAMVHDLRNPLFNVMTSLETVQWLDAQGKGPLIPGQQRALQRSLIGAQQMSHLIDNILDVSRLESGQMPLTRTAVSLEELIAAVVNAQRPIAAEKQLHLTHAVAPDLPPAWADAELLERVLQNLLDNAIKFTPSGGDVHITARPAQSEDRSPRIKIQVADTGPGIPQGLRQKLFQKFATGNVKGAGSGLGLAFSKLVVEAHGGEIWVTSPPDGGAVFNLTVPVRRRS